MMFCLHKWSKWSNPVETYNTGHKQQWRVCEKCNKAEFRTLGWDKQTSISSVETAVLHAQSSINKLIGENNG